MRILFSIHLYLPQHGAGGERYMHNLAKFLISRGHECRVLLHEAWAYDIDQIYEFEGVEVFPLSSGGKTNLNWADIVITHLGYTVWSIILSKEIGKPVIFVSHNTWNYDIIRLNPDAGVIYNSHAMEKELAYQNPSIVLHPATRWKDWEKVARKKKGDFITLVNLNKNKGARIFANIARAMPDRKFLAVKGGYDKQELKYPENVTLVENTPDMATIYERTRILLVPSKYESWGMCATEAMACGIPVIYSPTFGLVENLGENGIQIKDPNPSYEEPDLEKGENPGLDPSNFEKWVKAIKKLDNPKTYEEWKKKGLKRAKEMDPEKELLAVEQFLKDQIKRNEEVFDKRYF